MYIPPPTYQVTQPRPQVQQQTHGPPIEHYIPPPTYQVTQQNHQQMPMGSKYQIKIPLHHKDHIYQQIPSWTEELTGLN
jgi:hypothetical protein